MREILFKAKRIDNGEWVEGYLIYDKRDGLYRILVETDYSTGTCVTADNAPRIDHDTMCQYTGLTDKNGNKIWENDIVKHHFGEDTAVIRYGKYQSCFDSQKACHVGFYVDWEDCKRKDLGYWVEMIDCNVVGNVFDNADLLKE